MNAQEILARCYELGVSLVPGPSGKLGAKPAGKLPEELRRELKHHKQEILAVLLAEKAEALSWPCPCGRMAEVEEVDGEGRVFWTCPHCHATGIAPREPGKPYTPEPYTPQSKHSPLKEMYRAMVEISDDYSLIIGWLVEHHPERWEEIRKADDRLSDMERQGASEPEYRQALAHFLALLRETEREWKSRHGMWLQ